MVIAAAQSPGQIEVVRLLWEEYWKLLGFTPCFQGFSDELAGLPGKYQPPGGLLLLAIEDGMPAGAAAFRRYNDEACEAKRLFVSPAFRGRRIGRLLLERLIEEARRAGYTRLIGDTMPVMGEALALYDRMGFRRTTQYPGATDDAIYIEFLL